MQQIGQGGRNRLILNARSPKTRSCSTAMTRISQSDFVYFTTKGKKKNTPAGSPSPSVFWRRRRNKNVYCIFALIIAYFIVQRLSRKIFLSSFGGQAVSGLRKKRSLGRNVGHKTGANCRVFEKINRSGMSDLLPPKDATSDTAPRKVGQLKKTSGGFKITAPCFWLF